MLKFIFNLVILSLALFVFLTFSSSNAQVYKKTMQVGNQFGVIILPESDAYSLHIKAAAPLNFLSIYNCHRSENSEDASNVVKTIFRLKQRKEMRINYKPTQIEKGYCPMWINAFAKDGKDSSAVIDFQNKAYQLKAQIQCNGVISDYNGVSGCQAKRLLKQLITFQENVFLTGKCLDKVLTGKSFELIPTNDICVFFARSKSGKSHRFTIFAYDSVRLVK